MPEMYSSILILLALYVSLIGPAYSAEAAMIIHDSEELSVSEAKDRGIIIDIGTEPTVKTVEVTLSNDFSCNLTKVSFLATIGTSSQYIAGEIPTNSRVFQFEVYKKIINGFQLILECSTSNEFDIEKIYWIDFGK